MCHRGWTPHVRALRENRQDEAGGPKCGIQSGQAQPQLAHIARPRHLGCQRHRARERGAQGHATGRLTQRRRNARAGVTRRVHTVWACSLWPMPVLNRLSARSPLVMQVQDHSTIYGGRHDHRGRESSGIGGGDAPFCQPVGSMRPMPADAHAAELEMSGIRNEWN